MEALIQDLRYALRTLRSSPGFAAVAALTLALGIGANATIFSVIDAVLLRPLPYAEPDRLIRINGLGYKGELAEFRDRAKTFDAAGYVAGEYSLTGDGEPVRLRGAAVSSNLFPLLGAGPEVGRSFREVEDQPGAAGVVVLSHGLWQRRFGGDRAAIGRAIRVDDALRTIVGVMPPGFGYPAPGTELWVPLEIDRANPIDLWAMGASLLGRLRPGATLEQARAEIRSFVPALKERFPWDMPESYGAEATAVRLRDHVVGDSRTTLLVLFGAVGLVLLIACANVANLLLARANARRREIAVRAAIGAGRGRLVRQLLTESVALALAGGVAGLLVAVWGVASLGAWLPADIPRADAIGVDGRVLGFTLALALATGAVFGVVPALRASRSDLRSVLAEGGRGSGGRAGRSRLSGALVAAEVALAVVLVTGAGLLIRSFAQLVRVDPGFRTENVLTATVVPPRFRYGDDASRRVFYQELISRIAALPGVESVSTTNRLPFTGRDWGSVFKIEGRPDPATSGGDWPLADVRADIGESYLRVLGIPLLSGRGFTAADRADAPRVALVSESLAREYWPDGDAVGRRIEFPDGGDWVTIVGIVADVKRYDLGRAPGGTLYIPREQGAAAGPMSVVIRTAGEPAGLAASLRSVVASVDRDTPVGEIRTIQSLIGGTLARPRFTMLLLGAFAFAALGLGAIGIYGVLAYTVGQRTREIGLRLALGATRGEVQRLVVRQGVGLAAAGAVVGVVGALVATRAMRSLLFGVGPADPVTLAAVPIVLGAVALVASWLPARRAAGVDPMAALRGE